MSIEKKIRTDLAVEQREMIRGSAEATSELPGVKAGDETRHGFKVTTVDVLDEEGAKELCKPIGRYVTVELDALLHRDEDSFPEAAQLLSEIIRELSRPDMGAGTLVAGLGNAVRLGQPDALRLKGKKAPLAVYELLDVREGQR